MKNKTPNINTNNNSDKSGRQVCFWFWKDLGFTNIILTGVYSGTELASQ